MASGGERATGAGGEKAVTGDALLMQMSLVREGSQLKGKWDRPWRRQRMGPEWPITGRGDLAGMGSLPTPCWLPPRSLGTNGHLPRS